MTLRLKTGVDWEIEQEADWLLANQRRGTTKQREMRDYFTWAQMKHRIYREVYTASGVPDEALRRGVFSRAHNPEIGHRPRRQSGHDEN